MTLQDARKTNGDRRYRIGRAGYGQKRNALAAIIDHGHGVIGPVYRNAGGDLPDSYWATQRGKRSNTNTVKLHGV